MLKMLGEWVRLACLSTMVVVPGQADAAIAGAVAAAVVKNQNRPIAPVMDVDGRLKPETGAMISHVLEAFRAKTQVDIRFWIQDSAGTLTTTAFAHDYVREHRQDLLNEYVVFLVFPGDGKMHISRTTQSVLSASTRNTIDGVMTIANPYFGKQDWNGGVSASALYLMGAINLEVANQTLKESQIPYRVSMQPVFGFEKTGDAIRSANAIPDNRPVAKQEKQEDGDGFAVWLESAVGWVRSHALAILMNLLGVAAAFFFVRNLYRHAGGPKNTDWVPRQRIAQAGLTRKGLEARKLAPNGRRQKTVGIRSSGVAGMYHPVMEERETEPRAKPTTAKGPAQGAKAAQELDAMLSQRPEPSAPLLKDQFEEKMAILRENLRKRLGVQMPNEHLSAVLKRFGDDVHAAYGHVARARAAGSSRNGRRT